MSKIHPTAVVDASVEFGQGVEIGPYAIVGPGVRIGDRSRILAHAVIEQSVTMGANNVVGYGVVIGAPPQDFAHQPEWSSEVRIGDGNTIREYVTVHRATGEGTATVVGDGNFVMCNVHLGHNTVVGDQTIIANGCLLAGHVVVGDRAVLGGGAVFHQFVRIGRGCVVAGGSRFGKDIPPFVMADGRNGTSGINLVGLKRAGVPAETRNELRQVYRELFLGGRNVSEVAAELVAGQWGNEARELIEFVVAAKRRGVCLRRVSKT